MDLGRVEETPLIRKREEELFEENRFARAPRKKSLGAKLKDREWKSIATKKNKAEIGGEKEDYTFTWTRPLIPKSKNLSQVSDRKPKNKPTPTTTKKPAQGRKDSAKNLKKKKEQSKRQGRRRSVLPPLSQANRSERKAHSKSKGKKRKKKEKPHTKVHLQKTKDRNKFHEGEFSYHPTKLRKDKRPPPEEPPSRNRSDTVTQSVDRGDKDLHG